MAEANTCVCCDQAGNIIIILCATHKALFDTKFGSNAGEQYSTDTHEVEVKD